MLSFYKFYENKSLESRERDTFVPQPWRELQAELSYMTRAQRFGERSSAKATAGQVSTKLALLFRVSRKYPNSRQGAAGEAGCVGQRCPVRRGDAMNQSQMQEHGAELLRISFD